MKIYTEVIYSWDDEKGELVQESAEFYDYEGPLTLANGEGSIGPAYNAPEFLQYPDTIGTDVQNWIQFFATDFKTKNQTLNIALYIPGDALNTSYKSDYESVNMGLLGHAGSKAIDAVMGTGTKESPAERMKNLFSATTKSLGSEGKAFAMVEAGKAFEKVGATGAKTLMEQKTGAVLNPYMTAAYKGPSDMRSHDFTFQMMPQSINESKQCMKICKAFRRAMLPSHGGGDSSTAPSMLFGYPDEFEIRFSIDGRVVPNNSANPLFRIGRSVLTQCDLDFGTENVPLFFDDTQHPASIEMKLTFMEVEVLHREKVDKGF